MELLEKKKPPRAGWTHRPLACWPEGYHTHLWIPKWLGWLGWLLKDIIFVTVLTSEEVKELDRGGQMWES